MLIKMWASENSPSVWNLNYKMPEHFTMCYFQKNEKVLPIWLIYRLVLFVYFFATTLFTILDPNIPSQDKSKYMIFLTNWTYVLQFIQFGLAFVITAQKFAKEKKNPAALPMETTPVSYKIYWALYSTVLPVSVGVCVLFWALVYEPLLFPINAHNLMVHCINGIIMTVDFILIAFPLRFSYWIFMDLFITVYAVFTLIYHFSGGTGTKGMKTIYKFLDWEKPLKTLGFCGMGILVIGFLYILFWVFSVVKENFKGNNQ